MIAAVLLLAAIRLPLPTVDDCRLFLPDYWTIAEHYRRANLFWELVSPRQNESEEWRNVELEARAMQGRWLTMLGAASEGNTPGERVKWLRVLLNRDGAAVFAYRWNLPPTYCRTPDWGRAAELLPEPRSVP